MIGRLSGILALKASDHVMIDVNGVGYVVYCSERTIAELPLPPEAVSLWTEMLVREDLLQLFGFLTQTEREWHRLLTSVQGIGAKASLAILGTLGAEGVGRAIALGDANAVRAAPGVGPKIAARVVNELAGKAPAMMMEAASVAPSQAPAAAKSASKDKAPAPEKAARAGTAEALSALANLGYAPMDASRAVAEAADEGAESTAELIKAALKRLAPGE